MGGAARRSGGSRTTGRGLARAAALGCVALAVGCARTPWTVVQRSGPPSALRGATSIAVLVDATHLVVDGAPLAALAAEDRATVERAMHTLGARVRSELGFGVEVPVVPAAEPLAEGAALLAVRVVSIERRPHRGLGGTRTELVVMLDWYRDGALTDSVELGAWPYRGRRAGFLAAVAQFEARLSYMAEEVGMAAAEFFRREQGR